MTKVVDGYLTLSTPILHVYQWFQHSTNVNRYFVLLISKKMFCSFVLEGSIKMNYYWIETIFLWTLSLSDCLQDVTWQLLQSINVHIRVIHMFGAILTGSQVCMHCHFTNCRRVWICFFWCFTFLCLNRKKG